MPTRNYEITTHDAETRNTVTRAMTQDERAAYEAACDSTEAAAQIAADKAAAAASGRAKLATLGLTDDEIAALVGA